MSTKPVFCLYENTKTILAAYGKQSKTDDRIYWMQEVMFIDDGGDWEVCIGEQCALISEAACCRIVYALSVCGDVSIIKESLEEFANKE